MVASQIPFYSTVLILSGTAESLPKYSRELGQTIDSFANLIHSCTEINSRISVSHCLCVCLSRSQGEVSLQTRSLITITKTQLPVAQVEVITIHMTIELPFCCFNTKVPPATTSSSRIQDDRSADDREFNLWSTWEFSFYLFTSLINSLFSQDFYQLLWEQRNPMTSSMELWTSNESSGLEVPLGGTQTQLLVIHSFSSVVVVIRWPRPVSFDVGTQLYYEDHFSALFPKSCL